MATKKKGVTKKYKPTVLVAFIQDRSGSMSPQWHETLNGFKVFVNSLRKQTDVKYFFSLTCFDTVIEMPLRIVPLTGVNETILAQYGPRGGTSLYDAVGQTLADIRNLSSDFDKVIVVIVTDGAENASQIWNKDTLHTAVDSDLSTGKYTFTYLGAQPETWSDAARAGLAFAGSTVVYDQNRTINTYACVAASLNAFSASPGRRTSSLYRDFGDKSLMRSANMVIVDDDTKSE